MGVSGHVALVVAVIDVAIIISIPIIMALIMIVIIIIKILTNIIVFQCGILRAQPAACQFRLVLFMKQRTSSCMCRVCFPLAPGLLWRQAAVWRESGPLAQGALHDVIIPKENNTRVMSVSSGSSELNKITMFRLGYIVLLS